jgi:integrase/recombinase XerC
MNGREENEAKIQIAINKILDKMPETIVNWEVNLELGNITASTRRVYVGKIQAFWEYCNLNGINKCEKITKDILINFLKSRKIQNNKVVSDSHMQGWWYCLNNFITYLYDNGIIDSNYMSKIPKQKMRKNEKDKILLTKDDFREILEAIDNDTYSNNVNFTDPTIRNKAIIMLFMTTGMRATALTSINVEDLDFTTHKLPVIDKEGTKHTYILGFETEMAILEWLDVRERYLKPGTETNALFVGARGNRITLYGVEEVVQKYTEMALGEKLSPHKLRAGFCSILYNETHDIEFVRGAVGHSKVETTSRYIVPSENVKEKASDIMRNILNM